MDESNTELASARKWQMKLRAAMDEVVSLKLRTDPGAHAQRLREDFLLEKLGTLFVACTSLSQRVKALERRLEDT